jgi:hypothetical protein
MTQIKLLATALGIAFSFEASGLAPSGESCNHGAEFLSSSITLRRSFLFGATSSMATILSIPRISGAAEEVRGTPLTPFNSLIFQYRGKDFGGLEAADLNESSVSYPEFCERLKAGEVEFVEFIAPNGDVAYATIKGKQGAIRIGEGYPIEKSDGWSSPAFAVRTVQNAGVPYKFTVPALASLNKK